MGMHTSDEIEDAEYVIVNQEQKNNNEEKNRVLRFVDEAATIADLEMIEGSYPDADQEIKTAIAEKKKTLKK
jgi:hypothetical protein